jgi:hypothetical protein
MHGVWAPLHRSHTVIEPERLHAEMCCLFVCRNSLCGATFVAMMQTTDLREGNDLASGLPVYRARFGAIFVEREMCSGFVMILKI